MPVTPTFPGMYVEEISSGVHPITGVSTSDTAFIDAFEQGPVGKATRVTGFDDFLRRFGPLSSPAGYGVMQYFVNGGQVAWIVRVVGAGNFASSTTLVGGSPPSQALTVSAKNPGKWGDSLQVGVDWNVPDDGTFNLVVRRIGQVGGRDRVVASEVHRNLTMGTADARYARAVVAAASNLIELTEPAGAIGQRPAPTGTDVSTPSKVGDVAAIEFTPLGGGQPGAVPGATELIGGLEALKRIEPAVVNLLCIPAAAELDGTSITSTPQLAKVASDVATFCDDHRCFYIVDIPELIKTPEKAIDWLNANNLRRTNLAVYYPRVQITDPDPLRNGALRDVASSGTIAGLYARTDADRGIWKAPAGTETQLGGVVTPSGVALNDGDSGALNPLGINVIRNLPVYGTVSWGARTLFGADVQTSEWKYIPVRRTALYIEESLVQGLRWVVFEPNGEELWRQITLNAGSFMQSLFRRGAFKGLTPREAYLVRCDAGTTTPDDIERGIVNILIGFAPLKPAEFVVIQLQQLTLPPDQ